MGVVKVDQEKCIGCGLCVSMCPEVFELGDDGKSHVIGEKCDKHNLKEIVDSCPVSAISL
jgi:ferredoxin